MKKLKQLNKEIKWEKEITFFKNLIKENEDIWAYIAKTFINMDDSIFINNNKFIEFLVDFYYKFNFSSFSQMRQKQFYSYCINNNLFAEDINLFFFVAKSYSQVNFKYFEYIIENNKFLFSSINSLSEAELAFYNNFWEALFNQEDIPSNFINRYYYYFYNNKDFFYSKLSCHKVFFTLSQTLINKFKHN